jgi:hypothetical protein
MTQSTSPAYIGFWWWTWGSDKNPGDANFSIAFSGWSDLQNALNESAPIKKRLVGKTYFDIGGGGTNGSWTLDKVNAVTQAIEDGSLAGYDGIAWDIEEGATGLGAAFQASFKAAKDNGFAVLVTVSHSAPYGFKDGFSLMQSLLADDHIDLLSPQLYTTGKETANDYATSQGVGWNMWASAKAKVVPSIVSADLYADAVTVLGAKGVTLDGYIKWSQS